MRTILLALAAALALSSPAQATQRSQITPVKKKIGEGGLKGRQHWWSVRHGGDKRRLGDPRGARDQFLRARGLLKKSSKR